ncbi:MAG: hypothetical protein KY410_08665 [Proteobacteria bacterium]|nr:hypothetical protein [Pseudomonadota bacterium]
MRGVDAYDEQRDARTWKGGCPVVAHPPCRTWGRLWRFAKAPPSEKKLALDAVADVRRYGGVLEHPAYSKLWKAVPLPKPGEGCDRFGGYSIEVKQYWWGHPAEKKTWLYIVGCEPENLPPIQLPLEGARAVIRPNNNGGGAVIVSKYWREATPPAFARWLVQVAERCA